MIIKSKLWGKQEHYDMAGTFLRKNKFDLIVSGDNHQSFTHKEGNRLLINCGSLMRNKIDQVNHKPCIWIFDTLTRAAKQIFIPVVPFSEVFNIEKAEKIKSKNEKLEELKKAFKNKKRITGLDYKNRVSNRVDSSDLKPLTETIINEVMAGD